MRQCSFIFHAEIRQTDPVGNSQQIARHSMNRVCYVLYLDDCSFSIRRKDGSQPTTSRGKLKWRCANRNPAHEQKCLLPWVWWHHHTNGALSRSTLTPILLHSLWRIHNSCAVSRQLKIAPPFQLATIGSISWKNVSFINSMIITTQTSLHKSGEFIEQKTTQESHKPWDYRWRPSSRARVGRPAASVSTQRTWSSSQRR